MNLKPGYDHPIEQRLADLAYLVSIEHKDLYETDADALFMLIVRASRMYVEVWAESQQPTLATAHIITAADLNDPSRINDPHAAVKSLLVLLADTVGDNVTHIFETGNTGLGTGDGNE